MDRYNDVKLQLKKWEQDFVKENQRKPGKDDIDQAPEDTKNLYKEYRNLKHAKENSSSSDVVRERGEESSSAASAAQKPSDCWGSHLNRSALPASSPRLSSQERDNLNASAQYYGLKLKQNLATLSKEKPVTLRKSSLPGRLPLNTLRRGDDQMCRPTTAAPLSDKVLSSDHKSSPFSQRTLQTNLGEASDSVEPEKPFEPFKSETQFREEPSHQNGHVSNIRSSSSNSTSNTIAVAPSPSRSSLFLSLSPPRNAEHSGEASGAAQKLKDPAEAAGILATPQKGTSPFRGSPRFVGGFRGGVGALATPGRPSPVNRLSSVDRKWLERCQVFEEIRTEEKPGAGNQEIQVEIKDVKETGGETEGGERTGEGESLQVDEERTAGTENAFENVPMEKTETKLSEKPARKTKGGGKRKKKEEHEVEKEPSPPPEGVDEEPSGTKKRGRKRQRDGEDASEETGVKRKRVRKENDASPTQKGGRKRRTKEKDDGDGEDDGEKKPKVPQKAPQENLFGEIEEEFVSRRMCQRQPVTDRGSKAAEGNFVKINLKKKSHVKGYALRGMALRKQLYMEKFHLKGERFGGGGGYMGRGRGGGGGFRGGFRGGLSRQGDTCFKCGGTGHWAVHCKGRVAAPVPAPENQPVEEEPFELPTLEEVARATGTLGPQAIVSSPRLDEEQPQGPDAENKPNDEVLLNVIRPDYEKPAAPPPVEPLYQLTHDGKVQETPAEVYAALEDLGYKSFRAGQEEAIMRILSGLSTLVVLSTGMGKSLCYQLPAYLYAQRSKSIALVISPLVSLMDDQLSGLPAKLKAAAIHSNMSMKQREAAIEKVKTGQVCVLLLSPEALVGGGRSGAGCLPSAQELPPVAFACIDEAHCVSEWSHNFRPCYLRLCKVLRERLGVQCLLGLTATATLSTALDIAQHLDITDQEGIAVRSAAVPPNLQLSVSMDRDKDQALVTLLKGDRFGCLDSVIVYCTRREETTRVAALLRTCLQGVLVKENQQLSSSSQNNTAGDRKKALARKKIRKPLKWQAESYHAGLSASERRRVQNNFMCGELRIVVATVAFGMGLDKSDVRGIVHYNMPKSFESYVQEIGRAGRDAEPAHCHLFLDPEGGDLHELRRHIYADTVDYFAVKRLVQKVFPACKCQLIRQKQKQLLQDVEDSELLEMMDVCDEERRADPADAAQETSHPPSDDLPLLKDRDEGKDDVQEEKEQTGNDEEGVSEKPLDAEGKPGADEVTDREEKSCDWPEERVCHTHERAIPIQQTVEALDITEEGVETLLCYLELHPRRFVELLHPTMSVCKISCYEGPRQLRRITKICPPAAVVLARMRMAGEKVEQCDELEFDVVEVADTMGWELPVVKRGLRQLQWSTSKAGGRSGVLVEFSAPSFYFRSYGDLGHAELDRVCHFLHGRVQDQERTQLYQLGSSFKAFKSVAFRSVTSCLDDLDADRSLQLKGLLSEYFDKRRDREHMLRPVDLEELDKYKLRDWEGQIRADIRSFLGNRSDEKFTGRAVARIFHGIGSPCYPAQTYGRDRRYWRKYIQFDFNQLIRMATQEIVGFK